MGSTGNTVNSIRINNQRPIGFCPGYAAELITEVKIFRESMFMLIAHDISTHAGVTAIPLQKQLQLFPGDLLLFWRFIENRIEFRLNKEASSSQMSKFLFHRHRDEFADS